MTCQSNTHTGYITAVLNYRNKQKKEKKGTKQKQPWGYE